MEALAVNYFDAPIEKPEVMKPYKRPAAKLPKPVKVAPVEVIPPNATSATLALASVAIATGVSVQRMRSDRKDAETVRARERATIALRDLGLSYPRIGKLMNKDHTSILLQMRRVAARNHERSLT